MRKLYRFQCTWAGCASVFIDERAMKRHADTSHQQCPKCKRYFISLNSHAASHRGHGTDCATVQVKIKPKPVLSGEISEMRETTPDCQE